MRIAFLLFVAVAVFWQPTVAVDGLKCTISVCSGSADPTIVGAVTMVQEVNGVRVMADFAGLASYSAHAFHIHSHNVSDATNDCSEALGHFNPAGLNHSCPNIGADDRHMGDMGSVQADFNGDVSFNMVFDLIDLDMVQDLTLIVHQLVDSCEGASGDAGSRSGYCNLEEFEPSAASTLLFPLSALVISMAWVFSQ